MRLCVVEWKTGCTQRPGFWSRNGEGMNVRSRVYRDCEIHYVVFVEIVRGLVVVRVLG
jgi:hypothetical protein